MAENTAGKRGHTSDSNSSDNEDDSVRPLRKIRARCGFNLWHAEFSKTPGVLTMSLMCTVVHAVYNTTAQLECHRSRVTRKSGWGF